jgi:hypothetical protein
MAIATLHWSSNMKLEKQIIFLVVVVMSINASAVEPVPTKWIDATA